MDVLNYSAHCLEAWRTQMRTERGALGRVIWALARDLERAVKFALPDGGRVLDDERSVARVFHDLRLPFPVVALEYRATGAVATHETPSSKRIALVWDARQAIPEVFAGSAPGAALHGSPGLFVQAVGYMDDYKLWAPVMAMAHIDLTAEPGAPAPGDVSDLELELVRHRLKPGHEKATGFPVSFIAHDVSFMHALGGEETAEAIFRADAGDEISAALSFAAVTACANVDVHRVVAAPAALNKKRVANGKVPFFDTRILELADSGYARRTGAAAAGEARSHASPRAHLRRGHVRRLGDRNVWVNAAAVNAWRDEPASPRYELRRPVDAHSAADGTAEDPQTLAPPGLRA